MAFFWSKLRFLASDKQFKPPPPPILSVLDAKKQVAGTQRSRKYKLQHPYAPKFAIFNEKTAKNGFFFGSQVKFLVSDKQLKLPHPNFGALDAKRQVVGTHRSRKHNVRQPYASKCAISHRKLVNYTRTPNVKNFFVSVICGLTGPNAHFLCYPLSSTMVSPPKMFHKPVSDETRCTIYATNH